MGQQRCFFRFFHLASDSIYVLKDYGASNLYVPSVFTPNSDGINEFFEVKNDEFLTNFNLKIYSRWGTLIFEQNDTYGSWNGRSFSGVEQLTGVYFFVLTYESNCDNGTVKGTVQLIR